jgi:hypothetical protein
MKSLHAKLKLIEEGTGMQETAEELLKLYKKRAYNWADIDTF